MILDTTSDLPFDFAPSGLAEICQNLRVIVATAKGTCPLYRDFGVDFDFIDQSAPLALAKYRASIVDAINKYEPRVEITKVELVADERAGQVGKIKTVLYFEVKEK